MLIGVDDGAQKSGVDAYAKEDKEGRDADAGEDEGGTIFRETDEAGNVGDSEHANEREDEELGAILKTSDHVRLVDEGRHGSEVIAHNEEDNTGVNPGAHFFVELTLGFHDEEEHAVHGEGRDGGNAQKRGVRRHEMPERADEVMLLIDRNPLDHIGEKNAGAKGDDEASGKEDDVPGLPPGTRLVFTAKFDGDGAENQPGYEDHDGDVEGGEQGGVGAREAGKEAADHDDQPNGIPIPNRADRIHKDTPFVIIFGKKMDNAYTKIKAIEDSVANDAKQNNNEPPGIIIYAK